MCGFENCTSWFETAAQVRVVPCASKIQIEDSLKDNAKNYQDPGNTVRLGVDAVPLHPGIMTTSKLLWKMIKSASRSASACWSLMCAMTWRFLSHPKWEPLYFNILQCQPFDAARLHKARAAGRLSRRRIPTNTLDNPSSVTISSNCQKPRNPRYQQEERN